MFQKSLKRKLLLAGSGKERQTSEKKKKNVHRKESGENNI